MDELEISGKRYISAKRIARENRYHPDYVGQLIRAGRISGTKVGRAWYVDEATFTEYLGKERGAFAAPSHIKETPAPQFEAEAKSVRISSISSEELQPDPTPSSAETYAIIEPAYTPEEVVPTPIAEKPQERVFDEQLPVEKKVAFKTSLTYIPDNSPLFPAVQKRAKFVEAEKEEYKVSEITKQEKVILRPKRSPWRTVLALTTVTVVAGVFFSFAFFGSLGINSTVIVEKGKPASVALTQEKTLCFILNNCQNGQK